MKFLRLGIAFRDESDAVAVKDPVADLTLESGLEEAEDGPVAHAAVRGPLVGVLAQSVTLHQRRFGLHRDASIRRRVCVSVSPN